MALSYVADSMGEMGPSSRLSQKMRHKMKLDAAGSKVVVLELPYSTEFGRESRKLASGVRKYGKFDDGR